MIQELAAFRHIKEKHWESEANYNYGIIFKGIRAIASKYRGTSIPTSLEVKIMMIESGLSEEIADRYATYVSIMLKNYM